MTGIELGLLLVLGATIVAALARRFSVSAPIVLVIAGVVIGLLPGVPRIELDPEVALLLFLPPLLYRAAIGTSLRDLRANVRAIGLLSVGLVLATTLVVGLALHAVVPSLPLAACFALGAIVAPPDAVAATAVGHRVGLPRRVMTVLEGESLLNDATSLVSYKIAVAATVTGAFSLGEVSVSFVIASVGGTVLGLLVGRLAVAVRRRLEDSLVENATSLLTPFLAYVPADRLGGSGVLAVVVAGLVVSRTGPMLISSSTRLQSQAIWEMIGFLLEGVVFALIGLQLPAIVAGLGDLPAGRVVAGTLTVVAAVVLFRAVWIFPATYGPRLVPRVRANDPSPPWQVPAVISWAGMRGVVSLAAALALPPDFPQRDLLLFLTICVIGVTLVGQGATLPWVIKKLGLAGTDDGPEHDEAVARHNGARLALQRLDDITTAGEVDAEQTTGMRRLLEGQARRAHQQLGPDADDDDLIGGEHGPTGPHDPDQAVRRRDMFLRLRQELLDVQRAEAIRLWESGQIRDEALRKVQYGLDLSEQQLRS